MRNLLLIVMLFLLLPGCNEQKEQAKAEVNKMEFYEDGRPKFNKESTAAFMKNLADSVQSSNTHSSKPTSDN
ncbi:hypothetical protein [Maridesulfovibrio hydrothermalis]|uniref:Uncharacterized protein n=1 Tax=Maridesulfovibrio hydrothermalis AM13 = DSM 14728 TaxID=1121451 RepID=L0RCS5_9BACT|nr:hypothetical protein [Maridesulfovibrio hydrothermalis]CCO24017.1 exported protein of unknown function [Maridesulfovibrio hydrothermalis AM13 = DSM 14728]